MKCPKKSKEDFVIWYKVLQKKKQDKELTIEDPKYYFPNLLDVTIKELSDSDEGVYYCKDYEPDSPARKRFRVVIIGKCSDFEPDFPARKPNFPAGL